MAEAAKLPFSEGVESQPQAGIPKPRATETGRRRAWEHWTEGIRGILSDQDTGSQFPSEGVSLFSPDQLEKFTLDSSS